MIKYITLEDLQEARNFTLNTYPVIWLGNPSVAVNIGQVLRHDSLHRLLPGGSCGVVVRVARSRRSSNSLDIARQLAANAEMPFIGVLRHEGSGDGVWWSDGRMVK